MINIVDMLYIKLLFILLSCNFVHLKNIFRAGDQMQGLILAKHALYPPIQPLPLLTLIVCQMSNFRVHLPKEKS
jgi:hypothetical protein